MFNSILGNSLTITSFMACTIASLVLGVVIALLHKTTSKSNKNFITTLAILPTLVAAVILMVNGNLGTSVAVLGAFSLVRFRSIPGNSKEILQVFFAMTIGLAIGTGYIAFASLLTIIVAIVTLLLNYINFGESKAKEKILKIVIPEELDYTEVFEDIFNENLKKCTLEQSKTTNMGSMFELKYLIIFKATTNEKELIDKQRTRNGNLKISITHHIEGQEL